VWLVVQPIETGDCWVQNPILVNNDGEDRADHKGKRYEIRAFANPKATTGPGRVTCWPEAEAWSDGVQLVRQ
jgi:hypothetical protein